MNIKIEPIKNTKKLHECNYGDVVLFTKDSGETHTCLVIYNGMVSLDDQEYTWSSHTGYYEESTVGNYDVELIGRLKFSR
jgi:hypothetical protein